MKLEVKTSLRIGARVHTVFDAIIDPAMMSQYFISKSSGPIEAGKTITWTWADYNATADIHILEVETDRFISFRWSINGQDTNVIIELFSETENITTVKISEKDWDISEQGIKSLAEQTQGWVHMLLCLKAFVQYGINLRKV